VRGVIVAAALLALALCAAVVVAAQDGAAPAYFVRAAVDRDEVYIGQQVRYSFRLYTTAALPQGEYLPPGFAGFWRGDMGAVTSGVEQLDGRAYTVTRLDTALFPLVTGDVTIDPALLVFPATVFQDAETLATEAIRLRVLPLPAGAPEAFSGTVGALTAAAGLDRQQVMVGEPFVVRLVVRGSGNIEQMPPPQVPLPPGWSIYPGRTVYSAEVERDTLVGEKVFEWSVTAAQSGDHTLGPIELAYFDPDAGAYVPVSTAPLTVEVMPAPAAPEGGQPAAPVVAAPGAPALLPVTAGQGAAAGPPWPLWAAPAALPALAWLWRRRIRRQQAGSAARRAQALDRARRALRAAQKAEPDAAGRQLTLAVLAYVGDKLGREAAAVTRDDARAALRAHGVETETARQLMACLTLADQARFAPADVETAAPLLERTAAILSRVDAQWRSE